MTNYFTGEETKNRNQIDTDISALSTKCFGYPLRSQLYLGTSVRAESPGKKTCKLTG